MTAADVQAALERAVDELPAGLRDHVLRVVAEARRLARRHDIDEERAVVAALGHDLAREMSPSDRLRAAETAGLEISEIERAEPVLLHAPLSATIMAERFGIDDEEVLAAVRHHCTGRAGMSALEQLLFVADKTEPGKSTNRPPLEEARRLAEESLEAAMLRLLSLRVSRALERGWLLHQDTVAARNELMLQRRERS